MKIPFNRSNSNFLSEKSPLSDESSPLKIILINSSKKLMFFEKKRLSLEEFDINSIGAFSREISRESSQISSEIYSSFDKIPEKSPNLMNITIKTEGFGSKTPKDSSFLSEIVPSSPKACEFRFFSYQSLKDFFQDFKRRYRHI